MELVYNLDFFLNKMKCFMFISVDFYPNGLELIETLNLGRRKKKLPSKLYLRKK